MGPSFTISGIPPYDGVYPFDLEERSLTNRELHELKKETGVRGGELKEAMEAGDNDVLVMLTVFAVRWSGKEIHPDVLWNAKAGAIDFNEGDETEDEESLPPPSEPETPSDEAEKKPSSGATSTRPSETTGTISEPSPVTPIRTGPPDSDTGAISDQAISAI